VHGQANERRLRWALGISLVFMAVEVAGGLLAHSLALLADAAHLLTDAASLALALFAIRASRQPANAIYSYGHHRYEVLAAFVNGLALLALSAWIVVEAVQRLFAPQLVQGQVMLITASLGLAANIAGFWVLHSAEGDSVNMRAALLHVISDVLGSAATIVAAIVILWSGWVPIDPLLSILVALLIVRGGWSVTRHSAHILMEGTPSGFQVERVEAELVKAIPEVLSVHHVHVWSLNGQNAMMTLHAVLRESADSRQALLAIQQHLRERFRVHHATVQIEQGACTDEAGEAPCADGHDAHP
jgi:cobalt-zinc-cadmium efflux system protein